MLSVHRQIQGQRSEVVQDTQYWGIGAGEDLEFPCLPELSPEAAGHGAPCSFPAPPPRVPTTQSQQPTVKRKDI